MRVDDLEAKEFVVTEDGKPQRIALCHDKLPLSVVLLFDLTVTVRPVLRPLAEGALEILGHLKREDKMASMGFSSRTELLQDPLFRLHTLRASWRGGPPTRSMRRRQKTKPS
jgi:hypothetical protein